MVSDTIVAPPWLRHAQTRLTIAACIPGAWLRPIRLSPYRLRRQDVDACFRVYPRLAGSVWCLLSFVRANALENALVSFPQNAFASRDPMGMKQVRFAKNGFVPLLI